MSSMCMTGTNGRGGKDDRSSPDGALVRRREAYELLALHEAQRRVIQQLIASPEEDPARLELREILVQMLRLLE
jgi:hypothetical protein